MPKKKAVRRKPITEMQVKEKLQDSLRTADDPLSDELMGIARLAGMPANLDGLDARVWLVTLLEEIYGKEGKRDGRHVPKHRQCPSCWKGYHGVGQHRWHNSISTTTVRTHYRCDRCGHAWTIDLKTKTYVIEQKITVSQREALMAKNGSAE